MNKIVLNVVVCLIMVCSVNVFGASDDHHEFVVGVGQVSGAGGNGKLTLVEMPGHIELELDVNGSGIFISELFCWPSDAATLNSFGTQPGWSIVLKDLDLPGSIGVLNEQDQLLTPIGFDKIILGQPVWDAEEGWHFHTHLKFAGVGLVPGDELYGYFTIVDESGFYVDSDEYELHFEVVPEPCTLALTGFGAIGLIRKRG